MSEGPRFKRPPDQIDATDLANGPELTRELEKREAMSNLLRAVAQVRAENGIVVDAGNQPIQPVSNQGSTSK